MHHTKHNKDSNEKHSKYKKASTLSINSRAIENIIAQLSLYAYYYVNILRIAIETTISIVRLR